MLKRCFLILTLFLNIGLQAQDPQFTQFWMNPLNTNPALVGTTTQWRWTANGRTQWTNTTANYRSNSLSVEGNFAADNSGLGLLFNYDQTGLSKLSYVGFGPVYSYKVPLNRHSAIRLGMSFAVAQRYHDVDSYVFASDIAQVESETTFNSMLRPRRTYSDFGAGIAYVRKGFWAGFSAAHLNTPNYALGVGPSSLPVKYSVHMKGDIPIKKSRKGEVLNELIGIFQYKRQNAWDQIDFGWMFQANGLMYGLAYRGMDLIQSTDDLHNRDALIGIIGYHYYGFRMFYTYDLTISQLGTSTAGSHEIGIWLEYPFRPTRRTPSMRLLPCPVW